LQICSFLFGNYIKSVALPGKRPGSSASSGVKIGGGTSCAAGLKAVFLIEY